MMKQQEFVIKKATAEMTPSLMRLWQTVFGDFESYISLFFSHRFVPENTMVAVIGDVPVAMLYLLPITIQENGISYDARYIYAVGTHPDFRSKGLSGRLLSSTHERLAAEGVALSLLVPAEPSLFSYYGSRGFKTEFYRQTAVFLAQPIETHSHVALLPSSLQNLMALRDGAFAQSGLYACWGFDALRYQQKEAELFGGETLCFKSPEEGYALCYPTEGAVLIKEWTGRLLYSDVLNAIAARYNRDKIVLRLPADFGAGGEVQPFAMTKWYLSERSVPQGKAPYLSLVLD